jgi:hypothetical protein
MKIKTLALVSGVLLILAIPSGWPYSFYVLLRWVISFSSVLITFAFYKSKLQGWMLVFASIAFLFNPIIPIYLSKSSWILIDFISAILFFLAAYSRKALK